MPINKIDRKELKEMLVDILSKSATFKMLSKDNEVNPCRISFDGMEFYIYIKNLSPAQLSNNNPDIWRIQLPIREDFKQLKGNDIPFIALGYDDENKVFTTWNPYWVKQRLNAAKSVSLYSRLSLQKISRETYQLQKLNLNNDGEVVAFPTSKLGYYLVNIKQVFPEMTDYVAMGSRKRAEANAAYHCLCDSKNITDYASYLAVAEYSDSTINNYCRAIKRLISDGYFSRNRKLFLACDSLTEYPSVINAFFEIPEVQKLNEGYHRQVSNGLRTYIQYLLEINNLNDDVDNIPDDEPQDNNEPTTETEVEQQLLNENENVDWEALFSDFHGKLTRIANPQLLDLLRPVLDTDYRKLPAAYHIISEFYGDRFSTMELKDWNNLFNKIDWQSPYYKPLEQQSEITQKHKSHILKVITPDGHIFCERRVSETLVAVIKYVGVERVQEMNINVCANNMIVREEEINPRYAVATKYIDKDLYANTCCDTSTKASIIKQISDNLQLGLLVEFVSIDGSACEPIQSSSTSTRQKIKVTLPDGKTIRYNTVVDTFIEIIQYAEVQNVRDLNIKVCGGNLILTKDQINPRYKSSTRLVKDGWYCNTNLSTYKKAEILKKISESLALNLTIELD